MAKKPEIKFTQTLGVDGVRHSNGYVFEEFLPELTGHRGRLKYKEMSMNDATIGALLTAVGATIRPIGWKITRAPADVTGKYSDWFESVINDMDNSFGEWMTEALTFLPFGFSVFEKVYKLRGGKTDDPYTNSKENDGTIGIKKLAPRPQETIERWDIDAEGVTQGFWQVNPNGYADTYIPMSKCLLLRTASIKDNPEGVSILRNCYKSYTYLNNIQLVEAIAIEREMSGVPIVRVPSEVLTNPDQLALKNAYLKIARDLKMGEQAGIVLPSEVYMDDTGKPSNIYQVSVELIASQGKRLIDTDLVIKRYQQEIARSILADFLMLGISDRGSFSMSKNKTDLFLNTLQTFTQELARAWRQVRDELWDLNGFPEEMKPEPIPGQINPTDLAVLGDYVSKLATAGIAFHDEDTQKFLRRAADMPETIEDGGLMPAMTEPPPTPGGSSSGKPTGNTGKA